MKKRKTIKRLIVAAAALALVGAIAYTLPYTFYYGAYRAHKQTVTIEDKSSAGEITVMSSNLRCANTTDKFKRGWFYRAELIVKNLQNEAPDIIGFQEATKWQYAYLSDVLEGYASVIEYRDKELFTEGCPVFYRTDKFDLVDKGSFWLSETPEEMSISWGSACYRICSYVILEAKESGERFVVFNTHLDHVSDEARIKGIGVILDKIKQFDSLPSIIMGDFNCEENSETYKNATEKFLDAKYQTDNPTKSCTYQCFGEQLDNECIDYFMISKTGITVNSYDVITTLYDGDYPSDHFPIKISIVLK